MPENRRLYLLYERLDRLHPTWQLMIVQRTHQLLLVCRECQERRLPVHQCRECIRVFVRHFPTLLSALAPRPLLYDLVHSLYILPPTINFYH